MCVATSASPTQLMGNCVYGTCDEVNLTEDLELVDRSSSTSCSFPNRSTSSKDCGRREFCALPIGTCPTSRGTQRGTCLPTTGMHTYDYNPICGCDNITYPNISAADIAGINVRSNGQCRRDIGVNSKSSKTGRYSVSKSRKGSRGRKASKNYDEEEKEEEFALA